MSLMHGARANITEAIGNTPIVRLNKVASHVKSTIYVKCEYLNPGGSMKDRVALNIIRDAERRGLLAPGGTIVEATSGNTGAGLAMVAALRGYRCIFVMPDKMSTEKIANLRSFGAKVVLCPTAVDASDPRSYYEVTKRLVKETPGAFHANQYHNPANPEAHYLSTGPGIWEQPQGEFDAFVTGMGTGGTISGCGRYFKEHNPKVKIVGVDPIGSIYYELKKTGRMTRPFAYSIEGIGEDFLPSTMNLDLVDEIVRVDDKECFLMTRALVRQEGIQCGGSCGAAVSGAVKYAEQLDQQGLPPQRIIVLLPDGSQKYLSKIFDDNWMRDQGFLESEDQLGLVNDLLNARSPRPIITTNKDATLREVIALLKEHGISQVPVLDAGGRLCGLVAEVDLLNLLVKGRSLDESIEPIIEADYATVTPLTRVRLLKTIFNDAKMVCVLSSGSHPPPGSAERPSAKTPVPRDALLGVITKIDLIDYLATRSVVP
ncbi:MAG TPA: cystathionine beta-synthase [Burkholderiaceae bacterium]|nr:cystathionine beta-synthase [Burkholderiaceae bacterium]